MKIKEKQKLAKEWFTELQNIICNNVEQLEKEYGSNIKFKKNKWKHGEFRIIKGNVIDGHNFIKSAIKKGAKTIISNHSFEGLKDGILYIRSSNTRKILSEISYDVCKHKPKNLIAVTGTNGKSSIANFYFQILKLNKKSHARWLLGN